MAVEITPEKRERTLRIIVDLQRRADHAKTPPAEAAECVKKIAVLREKYGIVAAKPRDPRVAYRQEYPSAPPKYTNFNDWVNAANSKAGRRPTDEYYRPSHANKADPNTYAQRAAWDAAQERIRKAAAEQKAERERNATEAARQAAEARHAKEKAAKKDKYAKPERPYEPAFRVNGGDCWDNGWTMSARNPNGKMRQRNKWSGKCSKCGGHLRIGEGVSYMSTSDGTSNKWLLRCAQVR